MNMKIKKLGIFLIIGAMAVTLFGCKVNQPGEDPNKGNEVIEPAPEGSEKTIIKLYFANEEYIITGNEDLDKVIAVEKEIELDEKPVAEVILEELKKEPKDEKLRTLVGKLTVLGVETKGDTIYVDLSSENLNGGSMEEMFVLTQIVDSLTGIEGIEAVQFLVDGEIRETLMGHTTIDQPIRRSDESQ